MKADVVTKNFLKKPEVFADIVNFTVYGGESRISPDDLTECDAVQAL